MASARFSPISTFPIDDARNGDKNAVLQWQSKNGDINSPIEFESWSPLHILAAEGNVNAVTMVLQCGARIDEVPRGGLPGIPRQSPLHIASRYGHHGVVAELIKWGYNLDLKDSHGFTPLHYSAFHGHTQVVNKLVEFGVNTQVRTGLSDARSSLHQNLKQTTDGQQGFLASEIASASGHQSIADLLNGISLTSSVEDQEKLKGWLNELGCGTYYSKFIDNGYDFGFIEAHGLDSDDVEALGIEKLGIRKKLLAKYKFPVRQDERMAEAKSTDEGSGSEGNESDSDNSGESDDESGSDDERSGSDESEED